MAEAKNAAAGLQPGDEGAAQGATNTVGISASYGSQSSKSETRTDSRQSQGSTLTAGQNLSITANGKNHNAQSGDIAITGSQLKAGKDLSLDAARDITLQSAQNSESTVGKNESRGGNVGVGIGAGSGGYGISVSAGVNAGKGHENGNGLTHAETTLDAGSHLNLTSGRDTRLIGAQASGEKVTVDVGRDLRLESEQDSERYDARQQNASAGGSFTFGSMTGSANVSASKDKLHSNFDSVKEQTGLFAGKGGYDVKVKEHTQLDGAVIASTADKDKNRLDTGTLGWTDIHNQADYSATHSGGSFSTGGPVGKDLLTNMAGGMLSGANNSGHAEGATKAGVSEGTLIVRDKDKQQQDVAQLNRDTEHANAGSISPIFNKEKEQKRLKQAQLIGEIGGQAMDVIRTQGDIAGLKAALTAHPELKGNETALKQTDAYRKAMKEYGTGSDLQKAAQAVTGALTALAGNNLAGALASGASPYLATEIKKRVGEDNMAANAMAHAVLGAVTAQLNNQPALAGGLGAGGAELAARVIADKLFNADTPAKRAQLSESEKQQVSALSQLAAGLAGGLATGDTAGAVTAAQTGKNAVENNYLNQSQSIAFDKELSDCRKSGGDCQAVIDKWKQISDKQSAETDQKLKDNPLEAVVIDKELAQGGIEMTERPGWLGRIPGVDVMTSEEAKAYVQQWNSQDLANIDVNSPGWMSFASYASNPENQAALTSLGVLGKDLIAIAKNSLTTKSLFKEMTIQGIKFTPENVVGAAKDNSGKIIFLEKGNSKSGLQHIVEEHGDQFAQIGVSEARIPDVVMKAVTDGKIVGYQGAGAGRPIYETMIDGKKYNIAVTVGSNGYVVGANLRGSVK